MHQVYVGLSNGTVSLVDLRTGSDRAMVETIGGTSLQRRPIHSLVSLPSSSANTAGDVEVLAATTAGVWGLGASQSAGDPATAVADASSTAALGAHVFATGPAGALTAARAPSTASTSTEEEAETRVQGRAEQAGTVQRVTSSAPRPLCVQEQMGRRTCEGVAFNARTGAVSASWRSPYMGPSLTGATQSEGSNPLQPYHLIYDALQAQDLLGTEPSVQTPCYYFKGVAHPLTGHTSSAAMTRGCFLDIPCHALDVYDVDPAGFGNAAGFWASGDEATRAQWIWCLRSGSVVAHLHSHLSHVLQLQADTLPATGQTFLAACSKSCLDLYSTL